MDAATAGAYRDTLTSARQAAIDERKAEEAAAAAAAAEAQKKAEEEAAAEAAKKAATHYENDYFSVDVPESWAGTYDVVTGTFNSGSKYNFVINGYDKNNGAFVIVVLPSSSPKSDIGDPPVTWTMVQIGTTSSGDRVYFLHSKDPSQFGASMSDINYAQQSIALK